MKLFLATTLLAPAALSFTPDARPMKCNGVFRSPMITKLQYMEKNQEAGVDTENVNVADMGAAVAQVGVEDDALLVANLAFSLNMSDDFLKEQYAGWALKYNKPVDINNARFLSWKRNYLMQEVWNRTNGETFDLNEFGDYTKAEFDQMQEDPLQQQQQQLEEASHAYFFEEQAAVELQSVVPAEPREISRGRGPVARGGGFRGSAFARQPSPVIAVRAFSSTSAGSDVTDTTTTTTTTIGSTETSKQFCKVQLFSGGYRIVPVNGKE